MKTTDTKRLTDEECFNGSLLALSNWDGPATFSEDATNYEPSGISKAIGKILTSTHPDTDPEAIDMALGWGVGTTRACCDGNMNITDSMALDICRASGLSIDVLIRGALYGAKSFQSGCIARLRA